MQLAVRDILHRGLLITVSKDATIAELNRLLSEHRISGAPVVDDAGRLVGVVSQTDIVRRISDDLQPAPGFYHLPASEYGQSYELGRDLCEHRVEDIMETRIHSVTPAHPISVAARILRNLHIHRLVVLEADSPVGILTAHDLLRVLEDPEFLRGRLRHAGAADRDHRDE